MNGRQQLQQVTRSEQKLREDASNPDYVADDWRDAAMWVSEQRDN